ncbi:hypothetical protein [Desertivirga arenae]|uniref:hypothetical protein n=1 Tax=Desertivirga arenae TaxID=2810309 RepID=UPI001A956600|nr:hypothetical protein [Pedobacter sp. SYSU D00823]
MAIIDKKGFFRGPVGKLNFRYYRGKQIAQSKSENINQTVPSRESGLEFGLCSGSARVMREAFAPTFYDYDGPMVNRFTSAVRNAFTACRHKVRGERDMHDVDLNYLLGFQFNNNSRLTEALNIRVKAELSEGGKLQVVIPKFDYSYIKGIKADHYILRFLAVSFDFKSECYRYHPVKDISVGPGTGFDGGVIELGEGFPKGRVLLLSMSLHAYSVNSLNENIYQNSKNWSPSEIVGAWNIGQEEEMTTFLPQSNDEYLVDISCPYNRERLLKRINDIKLLRTDASAQKEKDPGPAQIPITELPEGDISFRK